MSLVTLIASDKPLPLADDQEFQIYRSGGNEIKFCSGFAVREHSYYKDAVDELDLQMKPYQYELSLDLDSQADLDHLLNYLRENFAPGEEVELWAVWAGGCQEDKPARYRGRLEEFDQETLGMLEKWHTCITIEI